jgi:hemerythrin
MPARRPARGPAADVGVRPTNHPCSLKVRAAAADLLHMFEWKNEYSISVGSVDAQHRTLFAIAGELHAAMAAGQGKTALAKILDRLVQYTITHFAHEERLMRSSGYPDLAAHEVEHQALTRQVAQFQADFKTGRVAMTVQVLQFLKDWLEKHIQQSDRKFAPFVAARQEHNTPAHV